MKHALLLLLLATSARAEDAAAVPSEVEARADRAPADWIAAVDARAERVPGLRYSARRVTERNGQTIEERWRFVTWAGSFRIDYFGDTARQVICDGATLIDHVPANGRAMAWRLGRMEAGARAKLVAQVLEKVAVPGLRLGVAEGVTWSFGEGTHHEGRPAVFLEGRGRDDTRLRYVIDRERDAVLSTEIHQEGQAVLRMQSLDLREVHPGLWFPHEVRMRVPDAGGEVKVTLHLTKVAAVTEHPIGLFDTRLDPSIHLEERP